MSDLHFDGTNKRWTVENFTRGDVSVTNAEKGHSVYIGHCKETTVKITAEKVNKIIIDGCSSTKVHLVGLISGMEIVRCEKVEVRAQKRIPTLQIDFCKVLDVYIFREFTNVKIVTSNSLELKIHVPKEAKEQLHEPVEFDSYLIPASVFLEQRVTQIAQNNKFELQLLTSGTDQLKKDDEYLVIESPVNMQRGGLLQTEFNIHYNTKFGEMLFIIGSTPELGSWNVGQAKKMEWNEGGLWKLTLPLSPAKLPIDYKYIMLNTFTKQIRWENSSNRVLNKIPSDGIVNDFWEIV